jgi:hypothetical protein
MFKILLHFYFLSIFTPMTHCIATILLMTHFTFDSSLDSLRSRTQPRYDSFSFSDSYVVAIMTHSFSINTLDFYL